MVNAIERARSSEVRKYIGNYPPVDILHKDNNWVINIALAGYSRDDIEISVENEHLIVKGNKTTKEELPYIYKGISSKEFDRRWQLDPDMEITYAEFENGMLSIGITKNIPEAKKPRKIEIGSHYKDANKLLK